MRALLQKCQPTVIAIFFATMVGPQAYGLTNDQARRIASGETDTRIEALRETLEGGSGKLPTFVAALLAEEVKLFDGRAVIVRGDQKLDPTTGQMITLSTTAEDVVINNRIRNELEGVLAAYGLQSTDLSSRRKAVAELKTRADLRALPLLENALARETDLTVKSDLEQLRAVVLLKAPEKNKRLDAARLLAESTQPTARALLSAQLREETDSEVRSALQRSLENVQSRLAWGDRIGLLFSGLSLGSILVLVALGLAITYGLMGIINMAHGELMMIGAYATYLVQNLFRLHLPSAFDVYILAAIPVSFLAAAMVGALIERSAIRFLYGRTLETLLATWGISLILMQTMRSLFGAQNVPVENPAWLSGGIQLLPNLILPYNRIAILVFTALVLAAMIGLISKTRLGLFIRGVTQNRRMAACVGVNTARTDTMAFALGSGIAGLAGCALSQVGNVGPDLGQSYIVDAFMVVVLGGVGQLWGAVVAGLGLGVANKLLEGWQGAVLAKIMVLVFIVVFIQKRPQGIFALKGRSVES